jgi:hypothetical protein
VQTLKRALTADDISAGLMNELLSTIAVFVGSKNREIVKSALGFVKVAAVALPAATVEPHLPVLVPALLGWVHDHKNHFKSKTVHIFERMIRKFGYDAVYRQGGEGSQKKVLENIKKRKDRAKRKKDAKGDDGDEDAMDQVGVPGELCRLSDRGRSPSSRPVTRSRMYCTTVTPISRAMRMPLVLQSLLPALLRVSRARTSVRLGTLLLRTSGTTAMSRWICYRVLSRVASLVSAAVKIECERRGG